MARSTDRCAPRRQVRGDALLEALIGAVLMAIIGLGLVYATSRAAVSQRHTNVQNLAVNRLRTLLQDDGISDGCATGGGSKTSLKLTLTPSVELKDVEKTCVVVPTTLTLKHGGAVVGTPKIVSLPQVVFSVTDSAQLGSDTALTLGN